MKKKIIQVSIKKVSLKRQILVLKKIFKKACVIMGKKNKFQNKNMIQINISNKIKYKMK